MPHILPRTHIHPHTHIHTRRNILTGGRSQRLCSHCTPLCSIWIHCSDHIYLVCLLTLFILTRGRGRMQVNMEATEVSVCGFIDKSISKLIHLWADDNNEKKKKERNIFYHGSLCPNGYYFRVERGVCVCVRAQSWGSKQNCDECWSRLDVKVTWFILIWPFRLGLHWHFYFI